ncbi:MAG: VanZ family protein [Erysipelotrichaceae bacterium]|nr:VanZ family protein [Erysipelotrichaceae bacterium]
MKKTVKAILLLFWMGLIFYLSGQPADLSTEVSDAGVSCTSDLLSHVLYRTDTETIASFLNENIAYVRKAAHVFEYFVLGILASMNSREFLNNRVFSVSLIFCFIYALSDELHQLFVPGRSGSLTDALIDLCGAFIGIFLYHQFIQKWRRN